MGLLWKLSAWLGTAFLLACTVTVGVQTATIAVAWSRGALTGDKVLQYTGAIYGLDPLDMTPAKPGAEQKLLPKTREDILQDRVDQTPRLKARSGAVNRAAEEIRGITLGLKRTREKYVLARDSFESLLDQLESDTASRSLREVQVTMELVQPKQAKDILRAMLASSTEDPTDDVMQDVVDVVKTLPDDKLKKILAEFKTDEERQLLHRILVEIGELDELTSQLSRASP